MRTTYLNTVARGVLASAVLLGASPALAQVDPITAGSDASEEDTTIVVTGSLIRGTPEDASLPVDVFTAEDLAANGIDSPLDFIKELPSVGAVLGDTNQFSTTSQGFQGVGSINLRGLDPTRTLVLLNGKRTILTPGAGFTDTNLMPLFALDRIELLKDGAAATYGSDAIAGVANFVTRRNFVGAELQGNYTFIDGSDGNYTLSGLVGLEFGEANVLLGAGYQHRSELRTTERDYTQTDYTVNPSAYSALSTPGLFAVSYFDTAAGAVNTQVRPDVGCNSLGGFQDGALCRFTYVPFDNIVEDEDRFQFYGQIDAPLSDSIDFFAEALFSKSTLDNLNYSPAFPPTQGPRGSGFVSAFTTSPANPGLSAFLNQVGLPQSTAANPIVAVTNVLFRPFGYLGNPRDQDSGAGRGFAENHAFRISGGFDIELSDNLYLDLDATYWESDRTFFAPGIIGSRLQAALNGFGGPNCRGTTPGANGCEFFNPFANAGPINPALDIDNGFYVPGAENSVALSEWLQVPNGTEDEETQFVIDAIFSGGTGLMLGGGEVNFAAGVQYRKNNFTSDPLNQFSNLDVNPCFVLGDQSCVGTATDGVGSFIFLGGTRPERLSQEVYAVFAEVSIPVSDRLEVDGAIRYEDYGSPIGSTINPKVSARFEATDWVTLRGSVGTTFRGPLAANVSPNGVTALQGFTAAGGNYKSLDIFGNPNDLGPETALTYNLGVIFTPGNLTLSIDYWSIDLEDRITTTPGDAIASFVANGQTSGNDPVNCASPLAGLITFSGNQCIQGTTTGLDIARVRTDFVNGPDVKISGIDVAINYDIPLDFGMFSVGGNASYNLDYKFDPFEVQGVQVIDSYDAVGFGNYFRDPNTVPEWRANAYANFNAGGLNARYVLSHIDGVTDDRCVGRDPCFSTSAGPTDYGIESGSFTKHDFFLTYELQFRGLDAQLQAGVENFTDTAPAEAQLPLGYNPFIGSALGRTYRLGLKTNF